MNSLMDEIDPDEEPRSSTDLTLGVGSLLSIFFGVVLICGIFFGFGYSMGRRNAHSSASQSASSSKPAPAQTLTARELNSEPLKPQIADNAATDDASPSAPSPAAPTTPVAKTDDSAATAKAPVQKDSAPHAASERAAHDAASDDAGKPGRNTRVVDSNAGDTALTAVPSSHRPTLPAKPHAGISAPLATPPPDAVPTPGHPVMVQIAAVSRQEDAEVLAGALRKRGFSPSVRPGTSDKFFHVQIGPFTNKADAETMKQHLLSDGYNAILK
jgi:cell division septation protein DedD